MNYHGFIFSFCDIFRTFPEEQSDSSFFPYFIFGPTDYLFIKRTARFQELDSLFEQNDSLCIKSIEHIIIEGEFDWSTCFNKIMSLICSFKPLDRRLVADNNLVPCISFGGNYFYLFFNDSIPAHFAIALDDELVTQRLLCVPAGLVKAPAAGDDINEHKLVIRLKGNAHTTKDAMERLFEEHVRGLLPDGCTAQLRFLSSESNDLFIETHLHITSGAMAYAWYHFVKMLRQRKIDCVSYIRTDHYHA